MKALLKFIPSGLFTSNSETTTSREKSLRDLIAEAKSSIDNLAPLQVKSELESRQITLVDIREPDELARNGVIPTSINAPRGMLEFYADPGTPYFMPVFSKSSRIILYCATGGRSALAAATLKRMGFRSVAHLEGGLKSWAEARLAIEKLNLG